MALAHAPTDLLANSPEPPLQAALGWLHRLIVWQTEVTKQTFGALADDEYRGLYIPESEVGLLAVLPTLPPALETRRAELAHERRLLARSGLGPIDRVGRLFELSNFERDVLLLALAPELDLRYERLYAYIQDDVTRKRPSVDLALRLFCRTPAERSAARGAFAADAPLLRHRLVQLFEEGQRSPALLARFLKLDDRLVAELTATAGPRGAPAPDLALAPFVRVSRPNRALDTLLLPDDLAERTALALAPGEGAVVLLHGGYGSGRRALTEAICAAADLPLLEVDTPQLLDSEALPPREALERLCREALLRGAALLLTGADALLAEDSPHSAWRAALLAALTTHPGWCFLATEHSWEPRGALPHTRFLRVALPDLAYAARETLWQRRLGADAPDERTLAALASTFRLSGGQIRDAVQLARTLASWRGELTPTPHDLAAACRAQSSGKLDALASKVPSTYSWDDIVLPADQVSQLREICIQVRHRRTVLEQWGFDKRLAMGKGVNVLFAGPSGTGKTMAAEIIAADLGLELYKIDLSSMVSKYIGETEKNLDRVFTAAREANAILFFDEADAIFGKRSEVKDAHDRYANIEVGYLLQKMESYDGIVILATNLRKNLDDAFIRRLHVAIEFPFPEEPDRTRIWRKVFPAQAPLADDIDLAFIARQFKLAGGNIRTIALLAAYLAAEEGGVIAMRHVVRAVKREYQKLGKLVTAAEFGAYLELTRTEAGK